jgi:hypothetical protein
MEGRVSRDECRWMGNDSERLEKFGAHQKTRQLFNLVVADVE